jgi:hypothetical protein
MSLTIAMRAPNSAPQVTVVARSGNSYTSDVYGLISAVNAQDVDDMLNMGCTAINYSGLPIVAGRFYASPQGSTQAAVLTVASTLYAYPVFVPNAININTLSLSVTTGQTGGKVRAALYADNGKGYPGAIVAGTDTGDLDGTGTAVVTGTLAAPVYLQPGWYWVGIIAAASSTMPSVIGATAVYPSALNALIGAGSAADALATAAKAITGISKGSSTYPVTSMTVSFPTFPAGASLISNATCPIAALGF